MPISNNIGSYRTDFEQDLTDDELCRFSAIFYNDLDYVPTNCEGYFAFISRIRTERQRLLTDIKARIRNILG